MVTCNSVKGQKEIMSKWLQKASKYEQISGALRRVRSIDDPSSLVILNKVSGNAGLEGPLPFRPHFSRNL